MEQKIKTGIASFGMSGQVFHGPFLKVNPRYEVIRILERSRNLSRQLFPESTIVRNYAEMLNDPEIELVVVNTPDALHYDMARQALNAGKHVIVEKPATQMSWQAEALLQLAREKGLIFTSYQNRRWDNDFLTVQKVLEQGDLGRLIEFESHFDRYRTYVTPNTWKEEGDEYSGVLYNLGSHMVDQAFVLFGKPGAVTAHLKIVRNSGKVADYYDIRLDYENFSALLKCSYLVKDPGPRYSIHGEKGSFQKWGIDPQEEKLKAGNLPLGANWGTESREWWGNLVFEKNGLEYHGKVKTLPGNYSAFYNNVFEAVRKGAPLAVKPEETVEVLKILEACLESNRKKVTVDL